MDARRRAGAPGAPTAARACFQLVGPPAIGHPGEDYNCRCEAIPYIEGETEFAAHDFTSDLSSPFERWENPDFVWHFFTQGGRGVTLREIGHLREIAEQYAFYDEGYGAFRRLSDQIANAARENGPGLLTYDFGWHYQFERVEFSHGRATVEGVFRGFVTEKENMLQIEGNSRFFSRDVFTDPGNLPRDCGVVARAPGPSVAFAGVCRCTR